MNAGSVLVLNRRFFKDFAVQQIDFNNQQWSTLASKDIVEVRNVSPPPNEMLQVFVQGKPVTRPLPPDAQEILLAKIIAMNAPGVLIYVAAQILSHAQQQLQQQQAAASNQQQAANAKQLIENAAAAIEP